MRPFQFYTMSQLFLILLVILVGHLLLADKIIGNKFSFIVFWKTIASLRLVADSSFLILLYIYNMY